MHREGDNSAYTSTRLGVGYKNMDLAAFNSLVVTITNNVL
jgi:hypothetical protein